MRRETVVIAGAGFAGLAAMRGLRKTNVDIVVIDRHNYHLFQPLLYQVASALLNPSAIAYPIRAVARRQKNVRVILGEIDAIDAAGHRVGTSIGEVEYDYLVVATGARTNDFGIAGVAEHSFGLKTLDDALALRAHVLEQFEKASVSGDDFARPHLTFCVVGGGSSGVEFAGALSELINLVLRKDYPHLDMNLVDIVLVEATSKVLGSFGGSLPAKAHAALTKKGVRVLTGTAVDSVEPHRVLLGGGNVIETCTVVWAAGVKAEGVGSRLTGERDTLERVPVDETLQLAGHPRVYVAGDTAAARGADGRPFPMLGSVAVQQGAYVARCIDASVRNAAAPGPFHYFDKGTMATIGRNSAVVQIGPLRYTGFIGWLTWLFVHLMLLVGFRNRGAAFVAWAWDYIFYDRPVRLITGAMRERAG